RHKEMHTIQIEEVTFAPKALVIPRRTRLEKTHDGVRIVGSYQAKPRWQTEAIEEYEESLQPLEARLRRDMASRVLALTGHRVSPGAIYADPASRVAVITVDGIVFKLIKENLVILRPCVQCGCCQFQSMPITNAAELGYALSEWEPRCPDCAPEDSECWLYSD
ncbi:MAG TPA: hypothetical protein VF914_05915, partial [Chloroflexia bacterium]